MTNCRACVKRVLRSDLRLDAARAAIAENDRNHPSWPGAPSAVHAAMPVGKNWQAGRTLRVAFRCGSRAARAVVMAAAAEWSRWANVKFVQSDGAAEVRCSFDQGGSWSFIGTDVLAIPPGEPTMNIGWQPDLPTCLHELGHTLGLIHEHENPLANIPWNRDAVIAYYAGPPNFWPPAQTIEQVLTCDTEPLTNGGYDRLSIMEYPIPAAQVTDPRAAVGWNKSLSDGDKAFVARIYPGAWTPSPITLTPPAPPGPTTQGTDMNLSQILGPLLTQSVNQATAALIEPLLHRVATSSDLAGLHDQLAALIKDPGQLALAETLIRALAQFADHMITSQSK